MIQDVLTRFEQYNKEMSPLGDAMVVQSCRRSCNSTNGFGSREITFFRRTLFCMKE